MNTNTNTTTKYDATDALAALPNEKTSNVSLNVDISGVAAATPINDCGVDVTILPG